MFIFSIKSCSIFFPRVTGLTLLNALPSVIYFAYQPIRPHSLSFLKMSCRLFSCIHSFCLSLNSFAGPLLFPHALLTFTADKTASLFTKARVFSVLLKEKKTYWKFHLLNKIPFYEEKRQNSHKDTFGTDFFSKGRNCHFEVRSYVI